jgi:general secretion pathway protein I
MPRMSTKDRGFTLIEVLVALVIAAIALSAISRTTIQSTDSAQALRDRQLALWVAQNELTQIRVARQWPSIDTTEGSESMAGREWHWTRKVAATPEPLLRRIEIEVSEKDRNGVSVSLVDFVRIPTRVK